MSAFSIQQLAHLVCGELRFGLMPPLGGAHEPVGRLVPAGSRIEKNDVVVYGVDQKGCASSADRSWGEEAYFQGALGVIANHPVCPWSGCFSLHVADPSAATLLLGQAAELSREVPLLAVLDEGEDASIHRLLRQRFELTHVGNPTQHQGGLSLRMASTEVVPDLLWQTLQDRDDAPFALRLLRNRDAASAQFLCHSDVVVVSAGARCELVENVLSASRESCTIICGAVGEDVRRLLRNHHQTGHRVIWAPRESSACRAESVRRVAQLAWDAIQSRLHYPEIHSCLCA